MNVKAFDTALDFIPSGKSRKGGPFGAVASWFGALNEGITLAGQYKELTARGVAPDVAVRALFEQIKH